LPAVEIAQAYSLESSSDAASENQSTAATCLHTLCCSLIQMYSSEDATEVGAPSLSNERRYEYKKLVMKALADVRRNVHTVNY